MALPPLINYKTEAEYRSHFFREYVQHKNGIQTFDGIRVRFFANNFDHAFFTSSSRKYPKKDQFDSTRAERIDWIKYVLQKSVMELYRRKMPDGKIRRIALEPTTPYAVIIQIEAKNPKVARFITAYVVNSKSALMKMRGNPKW